MRKLIVSTQNERDDEQAAKLISDELKKENVEGIVWFSNIGKKMKQVDKIESDISMLGYQIRDVNISLVNLREELVKIKADISCLKAMKSFDMPMEPIKEKKDEVVTFCVAPD